MPDDNNNGVWRWLPQLPQPITRPNTTVQVPVPGTDRTAPLTIHVMAPTFYHLEKLAQPAQPGQEEGKP